MMKLYLYTHCHTATGWSLNMSSKEYLIRMFLAEQTHQLISLVFEFWRESYNAAR